MPTWYGLIFSMESMEPRNGKHNIQESRNIPYVERLVYFDVDLDQIGPNTYGYLTPMLDERVTIMLDKNFFKIRWENL